VTGTETIVDTPKQERQDFVRAFAEHTWIKPGTDRPTVRPHIVAMIAALVALGALLFGVAWQLIDPPDEGVAEAPPPEPSVPVTFAAVSGWDCVTSGDHGFDVRGRTESWSTVAQGGWAQDGCQGSFEAIPMSGDPTKDEPNQYALWWFMPGPAFRRCEVTVYVPRSERPADSGATAAQYFVLAGRSGEPFAQFVVNHAANPGRWVPAGSYPVGDQGLAVKLVNRGKPSDPAARLAVAQIRASCAS
jgi:hypothetical protein